MIPERKFKERTIIIFTLFVSFVVFGCVKMVLGGSIKNQIVKNVGLSYFTQNIEGKDGTSTFCADDFVPEQEELTKNLENVGFHIEIKDKALNSDIPATQISASKAERYCYITYGLTDEQAKEIYEIYEKQFSKSSYYILVQNESYVYCFSDHKTFLDAGFESLATNGILCINEYNY